MAPSLTHTGRTYNSYYKLPESMIKANKDLTNILVFGIISVENLDDSIRSVLTSSVHLLCDSHCKFQVLYFNFLHLDSQNETLITHYYKKKNRN